MLLEKACEILSTQVLPALIPVSVGQIIASGQHLPIAAEWYPEGLKHELQMGSFSHYTWEVTLTAVVREENLNKKEKGCQRGLERNELGGHLTTHKGQLSHLPF